MRRPLQSSLTARLEQRTNELAARLLARQGGAHPDLASADQAALDGTLRAARDLLSVFFATYRERRDPQGGELEAALRDGTLRAGQAVPLGDLLAAYHEGGEALWEAAVAEATADEQAELVDLARHLLHWQGLLARAAAESFVQELRHLDQGTHAARRMLAQLLLTARAKADGPVTPPQGDLLERAGVRIPSTPVLLAYQASDGPRAPGATAQAVQGCLEALAGEPLLTEALPDGGIALLPDEAAVDPSAAVAAIAETLGAPVTASVTVAASRDEIPAAAREARELLGLAVALELPPGLYRQDRLLLEHALSARESSLHALAALLHPLERRPNLLATLETWFAQDFDRGGTAAALAIHRNTLDYRLRRVSDLSGLVLDSARGLQTAGAALLARRLLAARAQE